MGQEEISEMLSKPAKQCNLEPFKPNMMNTHVFGKDVTMKINGKKRFFALLMCAMLVISSMAVYAATSADIGIGDEKATCYVDCEAAYGIAKTTPVSSGTSCSTTIHLFDTNGIYDTSASGSTSATVRKTAGVTLAGAKSTHTVGSAYKTLYDYL